MNPPYIRFLSASLLLCVSAAVGCDPGDEEPAAELADDEFVEDEADDEQPANPAVAPLDELAVEAPEPSATYEQCPWHASFCFWQAPNYGGQPIIFPTGDFAVNKFDPPVRSILKRNGTYRVKLFSQPGFKGTCKVFGVDGQWAQSPNLFEVRSARRMEPHEAFCP